jgi:hypothetical protein
MDKPITVGLVFPLSGQRLNVTVPQHMAKTVMSHQYTEAVIRKEVGQRSHPTLTQDDQKRS